VLLEGTLHITITRSLLEQDQALYGYGHVRQSEPSIVYLEGTLHSPISRSLLEQDQALYGRGM
jgi:hypothetical protein